MDDDPEVRPKRYPLSPAKMSKTPSWIMLGFVLGALTVVALPPLRKQTRPALARPLPAEAAPAPARPPAAPPQLTTIEAVFAEWGEQAVWSDGTTEVALWNSHTRSYSDYFEVVRDGGHLYFRSIPRLTRREINRGKHLADSPLKFTETEEQYQEWRQHGRAEQRVTLEPRPRPYSFGQPEAPRVDAPRPKVLPPEPERSLPAFEVNRESSSPAK